MQAKYVVALRRSAAPNSSDLQAGCTHQAPTHPDGPITLCVLTACKSSVGCIMLRRGTYFFSCFGPRVDGVDVARVRWACRWGVLNYERHKKGKLYQAIKR